MIEHVAGCWKRINSENRCSLPTWCEKQKEPFHLKKKPMACSACGSTKSDCVECGRLYDLGKVVLCPLHAAAPELLEALKELAPLPNKHRPIRVWAAAHAAIAKAEEK